MNFELILGIIGVWTVILMSTILNTAIRTCTIACEVLWVLTPGVIGLLIYSLWLLKEGI